jgi:hypothetical protein
MQDLHRHGLGIGVPRVLEVMLQLCGAQPVTVCCGQHSGDSRDPREVFFRGIGHQFADRSQASCRSFVGGAVLKCFQAIHSMSFRSLAGHNLQKQVEPPASLALVVSLAFRRSSTRDVTHE